MIGLGALGSISSDLLARAGVEDATDAVLAAAVEGIETADDVAKPSQMR